MAEPSRDVVDVWPGPTVLEFGATWCPICQNARPLIDRALATRPDVRYLWVEDGRCKRLGRSFRIKLWPTLVMLSDGVELARTVRPRSEADLRAALAALPTRSTGPATGSPGHRSESRRSSGPG
jgi:thioredoxin 1